MLERCLSIAAAALLACPADAAARQDAPAGAPRHVSEAKFGSATVVVEHGQPPWSDDRLGQMAQLPPNQIWRMGSEGLTTIEIKDGPIFFANELIQPGRYGFNLTRSAEATWVWFVFQIPNAAGGQVFQAMGTEKGQFIPTTFKPDATPNADALTVDLTSSDGNAGQCELKWGPMRIAAPITGVEVVKNEITLNGNPAEASWFRRPIAAGTDLTKPVIAGNVALEIDGEDCSMNVYFMLEGANVVALFRNQLREGWERELATIDAGLKQMEEVIKQFGDQAAGQVGPMMAEAQRRRDKAEVQLEEYTEYPDNLKFTAAAEDCTAGILRCDAFKTRGGLKLEVTLGMRKALVEIDDSVFALKASG